MRRVFESVPTPPAAGPPREPRDVTIRPLLVIAGAFVVLAVLGHFALAAFFGALKHDSDRADGSHPPAVARPAKPPTPRLQSDPAADLAAWRAIEARDLERFGWVDRTHGVVRIPVERAMEILAARGLPTHSQAATESTAQVELP